MATLEKFMLAIGLFALAMMVVGHITNNPDQHRIYTMIAGASLGAFAFYSKRHK